MAEKLEGGCQCGAVRYQVTGEPVMVAICHCTTCRRATAAPMTAWAMFSERDVTFTTGVPARHASSAEAERGYCADCGTPISFEATFLPGLIDLTVASLDDPTALEPQFHYWDSERLPWVKLDDGLPRHPELPPMGED